VLKIGDGALLRGWNGKNKLRAELWPSENFIALKQGQSSLAGYPKLQVWYQSKTFLPVLLQMKKLWFGYLFLIILLLK